MRTKIKAILIGIVTIGNVVILYMAGVFD